MTRGPLPAAEVRADLEGGFRLEGSPRTEERAGRDHLVIARRLLKLWGADAAGVRATLAAPSAATLARWQKGVTPIPPTTGERVVVVLALYRHSFGAGDVVTVRPLPALRRPGRPSLPARDLLASGRLADLLALWRQMSIDEEAAQRPARTPATPHALKTGRRP